LLFLLDFRCEKTKGQAAIIYTGLPLIFERNNDRMKAEFVITDDGHDSRQVSEKVVWPVSASLARVSPAMRSKLARPRAQRVKRRNSHRARTPNHLVSMHVISRASTEEARCL
jgi:hypothetical protein